MNRQRDWRTRLHALAAELEGKQFEWGVSDCGTIGRQSLLALFGEEIEIYLPPQWHDTREAAAVLKSVGSMKQVLEDLGAQVVPWSFMRSGDFAFSVEMEQELGREALLVVLDGTECLASTEDGVMRGTVPEDSIIYTLWEIEE